MLERVVTWEAVTRGLSTPGALAGYVLVADGVAARLTGLVVAVTSVGAWWLFEWYNAPRFWQGGVDLAGLW